MGRVTYDEISNGDTVKVSYRPSEYTDTEVSAVGKITKDGDWLTVESWHTMNVPTYPTMTFELIKKALPKEPPVGSVWIWEPGDATTVVALVFKRYEVGWRMTGDNRALPWSDVGKQGRLVYSPRGK